MKVYSIFDSKVGAYMQPFFQISRGQAMRSFGDLVDDKQSVVAKHPVDYVLREIGTFDDLTGKLEGCEPYHVASGMDFVKVEVKDGGSI